MNLKKIITGLILALLLGSGLAGAADFDKGLRAYSPGDFKTILAQWMPLAEQGDAYAQYVLGFTYVGNGGSENDKAAAKWFNKAARQGHADAQISLGLMYENGRGVPANYLRAYMWYHLGSYNGNKTGSENKAKLAKKWNIAQTLQAQEMSSRCLESDYKDC